MQKLPNLENLPATSSVGARRGLRNSPRGCLLLALLVVMGFEAWRYGRGENSYVLVHDCLDCGVSESAAFAKSGLIFGHQNALFQPKLGGLPRNCESSEFYLPLWPYYFLDAFHAYVLSDIAIRIVALVGMALLLRRYVLPQSPIWLTTGAALCFALLPYYPFGLDVAGQPLLVFATFNLASRRRPLVNLMLIALFPFFSNLALVGFVLAPLTVVYTIYRWLKDRRLNLWLVAASAMIALGYLAVSYRLLLNLSAHSGFVSHRSEFALPDVTFNASLKSAFWNFLFGQYHAASCQMPVILLATLLALASCLVKSSSPQDKIDHKIDWRRGWKGVLGDQNFSQAMLALVGLFTASASISLFFGIMDWQPVGRLIAATHIQLLRTFNFTRVHWLHPLLWGVSFAIALEHIRVRIRSGVAIVVGLFAMQAMVLLYAVPHEKLTFHQFFSPELFAEIKDYIGAPQSSYRVGSIGMHPGIALYNGFYNVDGYTNNYPLEYKHRFRRAIAGELAKDATIRSYFDDWGSRAYLFSSELGRNYFCTRDSEKREVHQLAFDTAALQDLGTAYILSTVEVDNSKSLNWKLEKIFERDDSPWKIYLYSLPKKM